MSMLRRVFCLLMATMFWSPYSRGQGTGAPQITVQPRSQLVLQNSANVVFSVVATGAPPLVYEWRKDGVRINEPALFPPPPTQPTLRVGFGFGESFGLQYSDQGGYSVRVSNSLGAVVSDVATLRFSLGGRPVGSLVQTVSEGTIATFEVEGAGEGLRFQWRKNGVAVPYATTSKLVLPAVGSGDGDRYSVTVSNDLGSLNVANYYLSVTTTPRIGLSPVSQTVDVGKPVTLKVAAFGSAPLRYQWFKEGAEILGARGPIFSIDLAQSSHAGRYRAVVGNALGEVVSSEAILTVRVPPGLPVITRQPASQRAALGASVTLTAAAAGGVAPLRDRWFRNGLTLSNELTELRASDAGVYVYGVSDVNGIGPILSQPALLSLTNSTYYSFTTVAGIAREFGANNGPQSVASFAFPTGIAVDSGGNLFVADTGNRMIRKITAVGEVSLLAGGDFSSIGSGDGIGRNARFSFPTGVAVDSAGNVYVADSGGPTIRKISSTGEVVTLAGALGQRGTTDGTGAEARFDQPQGIAIDGAGNLFVAEVRNSTIRKITPTGTVTTLAGLAGSVGSADGNGSVARFNHPEALAVDRLGNVFVADTGNGTIRRISADGAVSTFAGVAGNSGTLDGLGPMAQFSRPAAIAVDETGNVFVHGGNMRKITPAGKVETIGGTTVIGGRHFLPDGIDGTGADANVGTSGMAVDDQGRLFLTNAYSVRKAVPPDGGEVPLISIHPVGYTAALGADAVFSVVATSVSPLTYQWQKNGIYLPGATTDTLTLTKVGVVTAGRYSVLVQNSSGIGISNSAVLDVAEPTSITTQPTAQRVAADGTATLRVIAPTVPAPTDPRVPVNPATVVYYQWLRDGVVVEGATGATLVTNQAGSYRVWVGNSVGSVTSVEAIVTAPAGASRLSNLSVRSRAGEGAQTLIVGFITSAANGGNGTPLLMRAVGPSLAGFGLTDFLPDPLLQLYQGTTLVGTNDDWGENAQQVVAISARVGAFALGSSASRDAALYDPSLRPNSYSAQIVAARGASGTVLAELYDATPADAPPGSSARLVNVSVRAQTAPGDPLIAGFSIAGRASKRVLVRAVGPSLARFGIDGILARPQLTLYSGATEVAANADWRGDDSQVVNEALRVGGFALDNRSADAALVVALAPGAYTVVVTGLGDTGGIALVEVYDLDQ